MRGDDACLHLLQDGTNTSYVFGNIHSGVAFMVVGNSKPKSILLNPIIVLICTTRAPRTMPIAKEHQAVRPDVMVPSDA